MENPPLERVLLILDLIEDLIIKKPEQYTFELPTDYFLKRNIYLNDVESLEIAFQKIVQSTSKSVDIYFTKRPERGGGGIETGIFTITGIRLHIENPAKLKEYRRSIEAGKKEVLFQLQETSEYAFIVLKHDSERRCKFEKDSKRLQIIRLLAKEGQCIETSKIAKHIKSNTKQVRSQIDKIRERIAETFEMDKDLIITKSPESNTKYCFLNIERI